MDEINEEIKLTLNLMQTDIDDGAHGELQSHLYSLLEIKRNELHQRLVERSWSEPVTHDQAPYKSVKLEGQIADEAKPLTVDELMTGDWWCADISEECRSVFAEKSLKLWSTTWSSKVDYEYCYMLEDIIVRCDGAQDLKAILKQIHRIGNEFYWGDA